MTTEEKRKVLNAFCDSITEGCERCPYEENKYCEDYRIDSAPPEIIDAWYAEFYPESAPIIKDSGERREFASGAVRDMSEGKGRMDLLPWAAIMEVAKHCENGAKKYAEHNVDKGIPLHSLCDSAARHLAKYLDGWDDEPHLLAAAWNLLWAIQMEIKHPEMCDVPWKEEQSRETETDR